MKNYNRASAHSVRKSGVRLFSTNPLRLTRISDGGYAYAMADRRSGRVLRGARFCGSMTAICDKKMRATYNI
ncbi:MAG: hypothetical protein IJA64_03355 [Rikenellaceae bacterium]|nr:hypothetical protein [Rikenellaceae bacterium]